MKTARDFRWSLGRRTEAQADFNLGNVPLLRVCTWLDGDGEGNVVMYLGVKLGTRWADPIWQVGVEFTRRYSGLLKRLFVAYDALRERRPSEGVQVLPHEREDE